MSIFSSYRQLATRFRFYGNVEKVVFCAIFFISLAGIISPYQYNILPATALFEVIFVFIFIASISKIKKRDLSIVILSVFSLLYVIFGYVISILFRSDDLLDFLQVYKCFYYIFLLGFISGKVNFSTIWVRDHLVICISLFLIKYIYSRLLGLDPSMGTRPGIWTENNYELIYLAVIYIYCVSRGMQSNTIFFFLCLIIVISGSRSAFLSLFFCFVATYVKSFDFKTMIGVILLPLFIAMGVFVFISRLSPGGGIEDIDRFNFLMLFLDEISTWGAVEYMIGTDAITELSIATCSSLSFYESLFSYSNDGSCYSVILHSFILRVIFDHGILGLFFVVFFYYKLLKSSGLNIRESMLIIGVLLSSALSVSSFNNVYVAMAVCIVISSSKISNDGMKALKGS